MTRLKSGKRSAAQLRQTFLLGLVMLATFELFFGSKTYWRGNESYVFNWNYTNLIIVAIDGGAPEKTVSHLTKGANGTTATKFTMVKERMEVPLSGNTTKEEPAAPVKTVYSGWQEIQSTEVSNLTTAVTFPSTLSNTTNISAAELHPLQEKFYQRHYDALHNLSEYDMLFWFKGDLAKFRNYFASFPHYQITYNDNDWKGGGEDIHQAQLNGLHKINFKIKDSLHPFDIPTKGDPDAIPIVHFEDRRGLCRTAQFFDYYRNTRRHQNSTIPYKPWPHVAIVGMHRDFGAVSEMIPGVTYQSNKRRQDWRKKGCSEEYILEYINHPETIAVITCQFHIWDHPKVHSIPIGMKSTGGTRKALDILQQKYNAASNPQEAVDAISRRQQLVMVNFKLWKFFESRKRTMRILESSQFRWPNGTHLDTVNTYVKHPTPENFASYLHELLTSKFVLSPSGWGIDCYRNYEALSVGNIPVMETLNREDGWFRIFDDLPVAWIDSYDNLTPQWLEDKYLELMRKWDTYNWEKVTRHWWIDWTKAFAQQAKALSVAMASE